MCVCVSVQVRLEWVLTLHDWMTNLRERIDHEPRLLPYLLSALTDPVPAVCEAAVTALEGVGRVYEQDHAKELEQVGVCVCVCVCLCVSAH